MKGCTLFRQVLNGERMEVGLTLPRYIVVGLIGVSLGMVAIWSFTEFLGLFYLVAGILSGILSILSDFAFNEIWTFSHRKRRLLFTRELIIRFGKFLTHKIVGFVIAILVLAFFTQVVGLHYLISNILAVASSFIWNYTLSNLWVWRNHT